MTQHVKNPSGVVWDVPDDHPAVAQAEEAQGGWRLATDEEIRAMYEEHGMDVPRGALGRKRRRAVEVEPEEEETEESAEPLVPERVTPLPKSPSGGKVKT